MATQSALARSHPPEYRRHRPEATLLYQVIEEYWPEFQIELAGRGKSLPAYITKEFEEYLKCGRLEHGFLRVRCESCHDEKLVAFSCRGAAIARLVALVPRPRVHLTRFHGIFAPNSNFRALVTPAKRGKGKKVKTSAQKQQHTPAERRASMTWPLSHIRVLRGTGTS